MTRSVTLVTPSYAKDIERFTLQRESIERCGIDLPHCALVNHEDLPLFAKIPFQRNLRILSTQDLLPPRFEARRLGGASGDARWPTGGGDHRSMAGISSSC